MKSTMGREKPKEKKNGEKNRGKVGKMTYSTHPKGGGGYVWKKDAPQPVSGKI